MVKMPLKLNALQTHRFGVVCAQFDGLGKELPQLVSVNQMAGELKVKMISTRVSVESIEKVHMLEADGYQLMDTLIYYGGPVATSRTFDELKHTPDMHIASANDANVVVEIAKAAFAGYIGHFHADPKLDNTLADNVYVDWASQSIKHSNSKNPAILILQDDQVCGFATTRRNTPTESEVILNCIHPDAQGKGLYKKLFKQTMSILAANGAKHLTVSTQINNYAVQKVWASLGLVHQRSYYTFHKWFG
jgi:ribosomal protein S18 acetylase RimI-like enzyme